MIADLWRYFFENDVESFRQSLAIATLSVSTSLKGSHSARGVHAGNVGSPSAVLATSPNPGSRGKRPFNGNSSGFSGPSSSSKLTVSPNLTRADINGKDPHGVTLLHNIASSTAETASQFAAALLQFPLLDLYIQDKESGWTALHRALYSGNITIARALICKDTQDALDHVNTGPAYIVGGLIKIKDHEGNSPFDVYGASTAKRSIREGLAIPLLDADRDDEETNALPGASCEDNNGSTRSQVVNPSTCINGDEVFTFGSNKNFTLGFGDEDDRQYPERVFLKRPDHLLQRFHHQYQSRNPENQNLDSVLPTKSPPALIQYRPITIQDVQLSKLHSAILTSDPEANLYICGFGPGGRIGTGDEATRFHFVCIHGGGLADKKVIHVGLGQNHTIAISSQGEPFTWGSNSFGQLGYASPSLSLQDKEPIQLLPRQIFGSVKREFVIGAAASRVHSVIHTASSLFTFGKNEGQLGLVDSDARSLVTQSTPRKVGASLFPPLSAASLLLIKRQCVSWTTMKCGSLQIMVTRR